MPYPISNLIPVTVNISPAGLNTANFASSMLFAAADELPSGFTVDTSKTYYDLPSLQSDFASTTETYKAASRFFSSTPAVTQLHVWATNSADADVTTTLTKARNAKWWYWTFFTAPVMAVEASVLAIAAWQEAEIGQFPNCQTGDSASAIRAATAGNIAQQLTTLGYRRTFTTSHATDAYAGFALVKHFAVVNYSGIDTTIDGEYKKSPGVAAEDLPDDEYANMTDATCKCGFYSVLELDGSVDTGRWLNIWSHSSYGETVSDIIDTDAFINATQVSVYSGIANAATKLPQTPVGQAVLLGKVRTTGAQFIANGYLGPRNYTNPDSGDTDYTTGFELLTTANDILNLTDTERAAHEAYPISVRLFKAGSIRIVDITMNVY